MKIDKAIEIVSRQVGNYHNVHQAHIVDALELSIEALKRIVNRRKDKDCPHFMTLPGETKD
ncbi:hypothetical protein ES703_109999 [subsurface metagenome]